MPQPDATADFLATLRDRSRWTCVEAVPVFKPHERVLPEYRDPAGKVWPEITIKVTAADMAPIARETNAAGPQVMTVGHRNPAPDFPERLQPPPVGWETNHRPGTFSPDGIRTEPCVLADLYYRAEMYEEVGPARYPFRSVDYDFATKRLTGLALLVRRPFLDLGVIPYAARRGTTISYAFEAPMPDATADDDKFTPEEEAQYARVCRYMAKKHPRIAAYFDGMGAAEPGATNATPPATYAAPAGKTLTYQQLEENLARSECERLLDKVTTVRYDRAKELGTLLAMPSEQRPAHVQYMLDTYQKSPVAAADVQVATGTGTGTGTGTAAQPVSAAGDQLMTRAQMDAAVQYAAASKVPWEAARQWAMTNVKA